MLEVVYCPIVACQVFMMQQGIEQQLIT